MGERGLISRILCPKFGGYLTFGTLEAGAVSAPGQPTIKDLLDLYNFRRIGPDTKVFGIIGKPVGHSKSPILYNGAFKDVGFNGVYVHLLVDDVSSFLKTYSSIDFAGFRYNFSRHSLRSSPIEKMLEKQCPKLWSFLGIKFWHLTKIYEDGVTYVVWCNISVLQWLQLMILYSQLFLILSGMLFIWILYDFSVTIPHKEAAVRCCDEVDPIAKVSYVSRDLYSQQIIPIPRSSYIWYLFNLQEIGAVNCVIRSPSDGKIHGYNTDYVGAITSIENGLRGIYLSSLLCYLRMSLHFVSRSRFTYCRFGKFWQWARFPLGQ